MTPESVKNDAKIGPESVRIYFFIECQRLVARFFQKSQIHENPKSGPIGRISIENFSGFSSIFPDRMSKIADFQLFSDLISRHDINDFWNVKK
jgi:hypothetical protein